LLEAKRAADVGKPALIVLWQHDPDITQHQAGLGTLPAIEALAASDSNLGRIRSAIQALGLQNRTNLMIVSDHGFATIQTRVSLAELLVTMRLKQSAQSPDVRDAP